MNTTESTPNWDRLAIDKAVADGINSGARGLIEARRGQAIAKNFARWQRDQLRDRTTQDRIKKALSENGLNGEGGHPHSWRCEDKSRYPGPCRCVDEIVQDVITAMLGEES